MEAFLSNLMPNVADKSTEFWQAVVDTLLMTAWSGVFIFIIGLILLTAIFFLAVAIKSYQYDMDPQNGVDVFEGVAAFLCVVSLPLLCYNTAKAVTI